MLGYADVGKVKLNAFLTNMADFSAMNGAYALFFTQGVRPVSLLPFEN
jgi:enamine deaminase RidA (YjgF/YER057c/UK114 family)